MKSKTKILVVDDNAVVLKSLSMKLTSSGYEVVTAEDGAAAVSAVRRTKPHLILLDINFPPDVAHGGGVPWDGFLIMSWVKRLDEAKDTPVIIITADDSEQLKRRALEAGASHLFHKPLDSDELLKIIGDALGTNQLPTQAMA